MRVLSPGPIAAAVSVVVAIGAALVLYGPGRSSSDPPDADGGRGPSASLDDAADEPALEGESRSPSPFETVAGQSESDSFGEGSSAETIAATAAKEGAEPAAR